MGFRFQKYIRLWKGFGINISKSGISSSYRNKRGSVCSKGFSIRTGISGLTYRKFFSKAGKGGCVLACIPLLIVLLLTFSCSSERVLSEDSTSGNSSDCRDTNCANYTSQAAAQAAYNADPVCRNDLDRDNDGIACEEPGNSVKNCATTSNCGCSGKNKSPCKSDPCCRWIVGTGCKCK